LLQAEALAKGSLVILNGGEAVVRDLTSIESIDAVDGIFEMPGSMHNPERLSCCLTRIVRSLEELSLSSG